MVLSFVANLMFEATLTTVRCTYLMGRYLIYGHQETAEEKLDKIIEDNQKLKAELLELKRTLQHQSSDVNQTVRNERGDEEICPASGSSGNVEKTEN